MILQKNYKGNEVKYIDVSADENAKKKMRDLSGNPTAVPPQIFNGDTYCGVSVLAFNTQQLICSAVMHVPVLTTWSQKYAILYVTRPGKTSLVRAFVY